MIDYDEGYSFLFGCGREKYKDSFLFLFSFWKGVGCCRGKACLARKVCVIIGSRQAS